jgi:hypothetical protein
MAGSFEKEFRLVRRSFCNRRVRALAVAKSEVQGVAGVQELATDTATLINYSAQKRRFFLQFCGVSHPELLNS